MTCPTTYREFVDVLRSLGAVPVRQKGGHEQWKLPSGHVYTVALARVNYSDRRTVLNRWTELRRLAPQLRSA
jgi:HicA-like toxin of HicAB toxin-antitoxin system